MGNQLELKEWDENGVPVNFPLFYDNYFVPRGYAVALVDMVETNNSHGCPTTGGYEEIESVRAVIDWLNGRAEARSANGEEVIADWTTGKVGMIGKSDRRDTGKRCGGNRCRRVRNDCADCGY